MKNLTQYGNGFLTGAMVAFALWGFATGWWVEALVDLGLAFWFRYSLTHGQYE